LTYFNQHCLNIYYKDETYKKLLDSKFEIYQADLGIFLSLKVLWRKKINRIDATAMNQMILKELIINKTPLTIIGGKFDEQFIQEETAKRGINLYEFQSGFFAEDQTENVIEHLSSSLSRVFMIGMGVPRQELFAEKLSRTSDSRVIICVGNFFEFYFGANKRAPVIIQKIGLEWMFRLFTEPRRLWKRYLIGIPVFIYRIIKLKFNGKNRSLL
ncbi:MAG: WecB/TagA/CpsF family glycosyltransferase, partial [Ignavibacteriaceae bacterium]